MICLVDMEHKQAAHRRPSAGGRGTPAIAPHEVYLNSIRRRLEQISNHRCLIRGYTDIRKEWLNAKPIRALILSGHVTAWDLYDRTDLRALREIVLSGSLPILGLCGGLQFIAMAHGSDVGPIRVLDADEEDVASDFGSGYFKEWGFTPIDIVGSDPLFEGLEAPVFLEAHYWEVKSIPDGFELLASTSACRIQALRRNGTLVYGTQFHPEAYITEPSHRQDWLIQLVYPSGYSSNQPDGRRLLANFLRAAGVVR